MGGSGCCVWGGEREKVRVKREKVRRHSKEENKKRSANKSIFQIFFLSLPSLLRLKQLRRHSLGLCVRASSLSDTLEPLATSNSDQFAGEFEGLLQ